MQTFAYCIGRRYPRCASCSIRQALSNRDYMFLID